MTTFQFKLPAFGISARRFVTLFGLMLLSMLLIDPAFAVEGAEGGAFATTITALTDLTPGVKATVAIVGFLSALISLVVLRSFTAALFLLGVGVFGSAGLDVINGIMGAPLALI